MLSEEDRRDRRLPSAWTSRSLASNANDLEVHAFGDEMDVISQNTGIMWSRRLAPVMRRAVAFCSDWTLLVSEMTNNITFANNVVIQSHNDITVIA